MRYTRTQPLRSFATYATPRAYLPLGGRQLQVDEKHLSWMVKGRERVMSTIFAALLHLCELQDAVQREGK
jgi:hypothetical protein